MTIFSLYDLNSALEIAFNLSGYSNAKQISKLNSDDDFKEVIPILEEKIPLIAGTVYYGQFSIKYQAAIKSANDMIFACHGGKFKFQKRTERDIKEFIEYATIHVEEEEKTPRTAYVEQDSPARKDFEWLFD